MGQSASRLSEQAMLEVFSAQDAMAAVTQSPPGSQLQGQTQHLAALGLLVQTVLLLADRLSRCLSCFR